MAQLNPEFQQQALSSAGGFAWWYLDLLDASGNGLVLIWSLGLPFLPGSRRADSLPKKPSVSLAVYRDGREELYLLQEHPQNSVQDMSCDGAGCIGRSHFAVERLGKQLTLVATLDEPVPGSSSRLRGDIALSGVAPELGPPSTSSSHFWTPRLLHATGRATISHAGRTEEFTGIGYFDGNASTLPLHAQGITSWRWARFWIGTRSFVVYDVAGLAGGTLVLQGDADGALQQLEAAAQFSETRRGRYGLSSPRSLTLDLGSERLVCNVTAVLEDGPFYQRFMLGSRVLGTANESHGGSHVDAEKGFGVYEVVVPDRIDLGWQRPFVSMRTHRVGQTNSTWLPLFSGWSGRRGRRLLASVADRWLKRPGSASTLPDEVDT